MSLHAYKYLGYFCVVCTHASTICFDEVRAFHSCRAAKVTFFTASRSKQNELVIMFKSSLNQLQKSIRLHDFVAFCRLKCPENSQYNDCRAQMAGVGYCSYALM